MAYCALLKIGMQVYVQHHGKGTAERNPSMVDPETGRSTCYDGINESHRLVNKCSIGEPYERKKLEGDEIQNIK